ncbi:SMI1/KNR4 family protein [Streptomyces sp. NPDC050145]|uniref:SMI1/KNR4 family protein n=1 Tax=Streptomyces sp. NPDC050145 TaxID=3365602 RepID=UPI00378AA2C3
MGDPAADLVRRVPPPAHPAGGPVDWAAAERELGTPLPGDYKRLVETYGRGGFWGEVHLVAPPDGELLDDFGSMREDYPDAYPYPLYPEPGGLLVWAMNECGGNFCWLTEGPPDSWPVVFWTRDDDYERHDCGAAEFLDRWTDRRLVSDLMPERPGLEPWFDPAVEHDHVYVRLGEGGVPYDERLRILRSVLGPTADRGSHRHGRQRQDHFAVTATGWQLTYETAYGHTLRVAFPREDSERARTAVLAAVTRTGCPVLSCDTVHGTSAWTSQA